MLGGQRSRSGVPPDLQGADLPATARPRTVCAVVAQKHFLIIGGGIVGMATAIKLARRLPDARITVLEKETGVGRHQSTHNSGVLHCGLYYKPGSPSAAWRR